jgi:beta-phosphoglucomutase
MNRIWFEACIFDLDGVIVDTAKYHFMAWKRLADTMGINFTWQDNERLKGVSRMASLEIILQIGGRDLPLAEKEQLAAFKNSLYVDYINNMTPEEILPGSLELINELKKNNVRVALGSASRNTPLILERAGIDKIFDAVADGNVVHKAKPDPEVFLKASEMLSVKPEKCIVFEDAIAGVEAALSAGMTCVGIGSSEMLSRAQMVVKGLYELNLEKLILLQKSSWNEKLI